MFASRLLLTGEMPWRLEELGILPFLVRVSNPLPARFVKMRDCPFIGSFRLPNTADFPPIMFNIFSGTRSGFVGFSRANEKLHANQSCLSLSRTDK